MSKDLGYKQSLLRVTCRGGYMQRETASTHLELAIDMVNCILYVWPKHQNPNTPRVSIALFIQVQL